MRFFFNPIIFLFELIAFAIQAVVAYGILVTICIALIAYGISTMSKETIIEREIVHTIEKHEAITVEPTRGWNERICKRIEGCAVNFSATTPEEYCPTCIWSKDWNFHKRNKNIGTTGSSEPDPDPKTW